MTTDIEVIDIPQQQLTRASIFNLEPEEQIKFASRIATALVDVIEKQNLYSVINGRKYVKVEGWEVLGTFLGVLPRERIVNELPDGSYEAFVDLIRSSDGVVIGGSSAICGVDEKRWGGADRYARRSMAITRAVGKAYRTSFSWIINIAGYEPTPAEEIPKELYAGTEDQKKVLKKVVSDLNIVKPEDSTETVQAMLAEISAAVKGKPMADLKTEIKSYLEIPFRN